MTAILDALMRFGEAILAVALLVASVGLVYPYWSRDDAPERPNRRQRRSWRLAKRVLR
ncbi:MAG TPA: hypothetical protein VK150_06985 [Geothrix sp.]|nr:hypothetical protein [Geothrix sp.]